MFSNIFNHKKFDSFINTSLIQQQFSVGLENVLGADSKLMNNLRIADLREYTNVGGDIKQTISQRYS